MAGCLFNSPLLPVHASHSTPIYTIRPSSINQRTAFHHTPQRLHTPPHATGEDDIEVAVFRFTLGIPGFDDAFIPRVIGFATAGLLVLNHIFTEGSVPEAQIRAEALGSLLAVVACLAPTIEQRLKELQPGKGRKAAADQVEGAVNVFSIQPDITDAVKQELAWSSYALLCNVNICGLFVFHQNQAVQCRGAVGSSITKQDSLAIATDAWQQLSTDLTSTAQPQYFADRAAINKAGLGSCSLIPSGAKSVLLQPLVSLNASQGASSNSGSRNSIGVLVLISDRERALSKQERAWAGAIASKLNTTFNNA